MWPLPRYLPDDADRRLTEYSRKPHASQDHSIVLRLVTNRLYDWCVENVIPRWMAPNVITLSGLILTAIGNCGIMWYCPRLEGEIPWWLNVYCAFAALGYQALDAMDGKQARRTGSGSALGMLFDHGCDALNVSVLTLNGLCVVQCGVNWPSAVLPCLAWMGFLLHTLEEYLTGALYLPTINMPNEGIQMTAVIHLVAAMVPSEWWNEEVVLMGIKTNEVIAHCMVFTAVLSMYTCIERVSYKFNPAQLAFGLLPVWSMSIVCGAVCASFALGWQFPTRPLSILWLGSLISGVLSTHVMVAHVCAESHKGGVPSLWTLIGGVVLVTMLEKFHVSDSETILSEMLLLVALYYAQFVVRVVTEAKHALGVDLFRIRSVRSDSQRPSKEE